MRLANYVKDGQPRAGIVARELIFDLVEVATELRLAEFKEVQNVDQVISRGLLTRLSQLQTRIAGLPIGVRVESIKLLSPILQPEKIFLVAVNYAAHAKEGMHQVPPEPYFFTKFRNALIGPGDPILGPRISNKIDWEAELAVIIGREGKYISKETAMEYVAGYTISNDISFRDHQFPPGWPKKLNTRGQNWVKGKGLDFAFPLGPWLVTTDEIQDPHALDISLAVNGVTKQSSNSREMVFKIDALIEYLSQGITLKPCDIISTGTPEGVAAFTGQPFLKDGDIVEAKISSIGTLRNPVKAEKW
jgi:2-keto-4-pentenoate hydratase/2-oxohepta-3-ene-1,7-dioic acid hydratase in catechol pathway